MIKVTIFYPDTDESRFDFDYYRTKHMPMIKSLLGDACISMASEKGLSGSTPGSRPDFIAMGHMYFESVESFQSSFGPHSKDIMKDIPNYTQIRPVIQISHVLDIEL